MKPTLYNILSAKNEHPRDNRIKFYDDEHKYIIDLIDISPDKSNTIEYCQICGYTKNE